MTPRRFTSVVFLLLCIALASVSSQPQAQTRAADPVNEGGTTVSSMIGIEDVFDPTDVDIYRDLAGGVTTANVLHGSSNRSSRSSKANASCTRTPTAPTKS